MLRYPRQRGKNPRRGGDHEARQTNRKTFAAQWRKTQRRQTQGSGLLKDRLFITGDIISPIDVEWDAMK